MPYINMNLSATLDESQKVELSRTLSQAVTCFSGKPRPEVTMVDIEDGKSIYMGGEPMDNGAYVSVCVHGEYELSEKDAYTAAVSDVLLEMLGIPSQAIYLTFSEFPTWGVFGKQQTGAEGEAE